MSARRWLSRQRHDEDLLLAGGELGFIEGGAGRYLILPCPWSMLKDVPRGPYRTRDRALDAVHRHLGAARVDHV